MLLQLNHDKQDTDNKYRNHSKLFYNLSREYLYFKNASLQLNFEKKYYCNLITAIRILNNPFTATYLLQ